MTTKTRSTYGLVHTQIAVGNTNLQLLQKMQSICGGNITSRGMRKGATKTLFLLTATNRQDVAHFMAMMRPYLGLEKRKQFLAARMACHASRRVPLEERKLLYPRKLQA